MKSGKKSFIGRCSFNSLCYETVAQLFNNTAGEDAP